MESQNMLTTKLIFKKVNFLLQFQSRFYILFNRENVLFTSSCNLGRNTMFLVYKQVDFNFQNDELDSTSYLER